jgi:hypothetical protein
MNPQFLKALGTDPILELQAARRGHDDASE